MEILFNDDGMPLMMASDRIFAVTTQPTAQLYETPGEVFTFRGREYVAWGAGNRAPDEMTRIIGSTAVLSTAIGFKARTSFGQGCEVGVSETEVSEAERGAFDWLSGWLGSYEFRQYASGAFRDLFKFANAFPVLVMSKDGERVERVGVRNARHCRLSVDKRWLLVFADFDRRNPSEKDEVEVLRMLDEDDPMADLERLNRTGRLKGGRVVAFPRLRNYYSNNDFYGIPDWDAARRSGWIDIARQVPLFLKKAYANAMSMMWHIQIPSTFWEREFPKRENGEDERRRKIEEYMKGIEDNLCGDRNANKALFTTFSINQTGRAEERWVIDRLKNEIEATERLTTSAAANSEILFSLMINPSVMGAGMPGGAYAGTAGSGSDIRESFLISVITTYIEKQQVLDPVRLAMRFNFGVELPIRYKETLLTTLNTGGATTAAGVS